MELFRNGRIFDGVKFLGEGFDMVVRGGTVERIGKDLPDDGAEILDVGGAIVCPGFIDLHVHFRDPGYEWREDIGSGSRAAASGGYTTVVTMPNTSPVVDSEAMVEYVVARGHRSDGARILPAGCVSAGRKGQRLAELGLMAEAGAVLFTDDGGPVSDAGLLRTALRYSRDLGVRIMEHPEELSLTEKGQVNEGVVSASSGLKGWPVSAELIDVQKGIALCRETDAPIHFTHVSSGLAIEAIRSAKTEGLPVTCDVTPHHLTLDETAILVSRFSSTYKVNPPLRTRADVKALWKALEDGVVDAIATDHAPYHMDEKDLPFQEATSGIASIECSVAVVLDGWAKLGKPLPLEHLLARFTSGPASVLPGKWRSLGVLKEGAVADVTVIDPEAVRKVDVTTWKSKARLCPWNNEFLQGWPVLTMVDGKIVMNRLEERE